MRNWNRLARQLRILRDEYLIWCDLNSHDPEDRDKVVEGLEIFQEWVKENYRMVRAKKKPVRHLWK